jgi:hypothetical protein
MVGEDQVNGLQLSMAGGLQQVRGGGRGHALSGLARNMQDVQAVNAEVGGKAPLQGCCSSNSCGRYQHTTTAAAAAAAAACCE